MVADQGVRVIPLKEAVTKLVDGSHNPPPKREVGKPMLSARNIENGRIVFDSYRFIDEAAFAHEHARSRVTANDVLLTIVGTIGRTAVVSEGLPPFALQRSVAVLTPRNDLLPKYLCYQLQAPATQRYFEENARGTAQKGVYLKTLGATPIQVPSLNKQLEVVDEIEKQFSRLDEAVANLQRVKANLKRYKASVLKAAVEGRLVETEASIAQREGRSYETGEQLLQRVLEERRAKWAGHGSFSAEPPSESLEFVPDGWDVASLDQLSTVVRGGSPRPAGDPRYFGGSVPWITVGSITADETDYLRQANGGLTEEGKERSRFIEEHTLLLTNSGATLGVPKISLISGCINDGVAALLDVEYPLKKYLLNYLRTRTDALRQVNQGAAQPNLNTTIIKAMVVPLPPASEQARILAEVDRHISIIREVEAEVDANMQRAQALRQSTLSSAFSPKP